VKMGTTFRSAAPPQGWVRAGRLGLQLSPHAVPQPGCEAPERPHRPQEIGGAYKSCAPSSLVSACSACAWSSGGRPPTERGWEGGRLKAATVRSDRGGRAQYGKRSASIETRPGETLRLDGALGYHRGVRP
jgi:hypothetical protein